MQPKGNNLLLKEKEQSIKRFCGMQTSSCSQDDHNDVEQFVEYVEGSLPIVLTVPHGGLHAPSSIPTRTFI